MDGHPRSLASLLGPPRNAEQGLALLAAQGLGPRLCTRCTTTTFTPPPYRERAGDTICPGCRTLEWHAAVRHYHKHGCFPEDVGATITTDSTTT